jgi:hypothetical protein
MVRTADSRGTRKFDYTYRLTFEVPKSVYEIAYTVSFYTDSDELLGADSKTIGASLGSAMSTGTIELAGYPQNYELSDFKVSKSSGF